MTCIVGLKHGEDIWIGGDSAGIVGHWLSIRADEKVFQNGQFLIGFTSSFRMGQILRYSFQHPDHDASLTTEAYLASVWVDAVRTCFKEKGFARKENEAESGGCFLIGYRGELWEIDNDYQVARWDDGFAAIGGGTQVALGSLFTSRDSPGLADDPESRVRIALSAAQRFNTTVREPFVIRRLQSNTQ
jgi:ATP-dependent protease HslVU (ClpYQ) peptidase subunit